MRQERGWVADLPSGQVRCRSLTAICNKVRSIHGGKNVEILLPQGLERIRSRGVEARKRWKKAVEQARIDYEIELERLLQDEQLSSRDAGFLFGLSHVSVCELLMARMGRRGG